MVPPPPPDADTDAPSPARTRAARGSGPITSAILHSARYKKRARKVQQLHPRSAQSQLYNDRLVEQIEQNGKHQDPKCFRCERSGSECVMWIGKASRSSRCARCTRSKMTCSLTALLADAESGDNSFEETEPAPGYKYKRRRRGKGKMVRKRQRIVKDSEDEEDEDEDAEEGYSAGYSADGDEDSEVEDIEVAYEGEEDIDSADEGEDQSPLQKKPKKSATIKRGPRRQRIGTPTGPVTVASTRQRRHLGGPTDGQKRGNPENYAHPNERNEHRGDDACENCQREGKDCVGWEGHCCMRCGSIGISCSLLDGYSLAGSGNQRHISLLDDNDPEPMASMANRTNHDMRFTREKFISSTSSTPVANAPRDSRPVYANRSLDEWLGIGLPSFLSTSRTEPHSPLPASCPQSFPRLSALRAHQAVNPLIAIAPLVPTAMHREPASKSEPPRAPLLPSPEATTSSSSQVSNTSNRDLSAAGASSPSTDSTTPKPDREPPSPILAQDLPPRSLDDVEGDAVEWVQKQVRAQHHEIDTLKTQARVWREEIERWRTRDTLRELRLVEAERALRVEKERAEGLEEKLRVLATDVYILGIRGREKE